MSDPTLPAERYEPPVDALTTVKVTLAWLFVGIPLAWAVWQVFVKALLLFRE